MPTKPKPRAKKIVKPTSKPKTAIMLFHGFGLVSEEKWPILKTEPGVVVLKTDEDESKCFRFDSKTGRCLNDSNFMECYRTLKIT